MKIIIVGCGKVGYSLAEQLNEEGHEITVIDTNEDKVGMVGNALDVMGFLGNATSHTAQLEAGIADADLLIAVTNMDEVNLLCCLIARKAGHCQTIARVRNPGYYSEINYIKDELGLSLAINPELAAAEDISRLIHVPSAMDVDSFAKGKVDLIRFRVPENSAWCDKKLIDINKRFSGNMLVCIIERAGSREILIPDGNAEIHAGDSISVMVPMESLKALFNSVGVESRTIRDVMIVGGGTIAYYLATKLLKSKIKVKIIEKNKERCEWLSEQLPKAMIICGDATNTELLKEEGVETADAFVALTGVDEENVMVSYYTGKVSRAKVITKINKIGYDSILENFELGSITSPRKLTTETILKYVRGMQNSVGSAVEAVYRLADGRAEALEFTVKKDSRVLGTPLAQMKLRNNLLLCNIVRKGRAILPTGQVSICADDTVIVVTTHKGLNEIDDILA